MAESTPTTRVVRFGVFEADLHAGELRKNGLRIKLQEQPFQILAMLLACLKDDDDSVVLTRLDVPSDSDLPLEKVPTQKEVQ